MPAVSICDPLAMAMRHSLDAAGQSKAMDDLGISLAGSASRILHTELEYEEVDNFRCSMQDQLKAKYQVLSLPKQLENGVDINGKSKTPDKVNGTNSNNNNNNNNDKSNKEPKLPEPTTMLYPPHKVTLGWNKPCPVGAGMYNVGNTCYLNSTLQALFHVPALVNWLLSDPHHDSKCNHNGVSECLTCAMAKTLQSSHHSNVIRPHWIYDKLKQICRTMDHGQQEDAHEFLRYLLEGMEKAYIARHKAQKLDSYSKETTPINQIFGGYIRTEVKCQQCRHISTTFQHFQDLLLDIRKVSTLDEALAAYFSQEQLDNNDYKCEACKRRVPATKQFSLERPPKVLCVQLKRFSVMGGKISRHISFKPTIDIGAYIRRNPREPQRRVIYRLTSIVTHVGSSVNSGHYTAVAQVSTGKYYSFDDSSVYPLNLQQALNTNAYIIIFEMDPSTLSAQSLPSPSTSNPIPKTIPYSQMNGTSHKNQNGKLSSNVNNSSKNEESESSKIRDNGHSSVPAPPPPPPPPAPPIISNTNGIRQTFIGPQLPPHMTEKAAQGKLFEVSPKKSLVQYSAETSSDEEEDQNTATQSKTSLQNDSPKKLVHSVNNVSSKNNEVCNSNARDSNTPPVNQKYNQYQMTNGHKKNKSSSPENSKYTTDREESNKEFENRNKDQKDKRRSDYHGRSNSFERIHTKAVVASTKGWEVDEISASASSHKPNGWSISDDYSSESSNKSTAYSRNYHSNTPRKFNGSSHSNHSDPVSYLQKSSQWAYGGNGHVQNWNGNRSRLDKEVDNDRRGNRKRFLDNDDDDEMDRGRVKKIRNNGEYRSRNGYNSKYNPFTEFSRNNNSNNTFNDYNNRRSDSYKDYRYNNRNNYHDNYNKHQKYNRNNNHHNRHRFNHNQRHWPRR